MQMTTNSRPLYPETSQEAFREISSRRAMSRCVCHHLARTEYNRSKIPRIRRSKTTHAHQRSCR